MDRLLIRPMREPDCEGALTLWRSTAGIGLSPADEPERLHGYLARNPGLSQVAEFRGHLMGALLCGHDGRRGYLHHLAVEAAWRSLGVGRGMVEACQVQLRKEGIDRCHIFVFPDNLSGIEFWRRMGFAIRQDIQLWSLDL